MMPFVAFNHLGYYQVNQSYLFQSFLPLTFATTFLTKKLQPSLKGNG